MSRRLKFIFVKIIQNDDNRKAPVKVCQAFITSFEKAGDSNLANKDVSFPTYGARGLMLDLNFTETVIMDPSKSKRL